MKRSLLIVLSAIAGLLAGFALRALRQQHGATAANSSIANSSSAQAGTHANTGYPNHREANALATKLKSELAVSDGVTRWLLWITAVEKATPKDFPHLARMAKDIPGAVAILGARWLEADPQGLFEACMSGDAGFPREELGDLLFREWPKKDPEAVLAVLKATPLLPMGWQFQSLETLFALRPEQALITMSELRISSFGPGMGGVEKWIAADPRHAAEVALAHPCGFATAQVLMSLGTQWAKSDPQGALAFAATQNTTSGRQLANLLIKKWVENDPDKASDWFAKVDDGTSRRLLPSFVEAWGKQDANSALQWCLANTKGGRQFDLIASLVKGSLQKSPDDAAALVAGMEPSAARSKAAAAFAEAVLHQGWWPNMVTQTPDGKAKPEAIAWLQQLDPAARKEAISTITWSWSEHDPQGFIEFLRSPAGQAAGPEAMATAATALVRKQPLEAMALANEVPEAGRQDALMETFSNWNRYQPEAAMDWLRKLPASDARRETFLLGVVREAVPSEAFANNAAASPETLRKAQQDLARQLATSPAAAREQLRQLSLPAETRASVMARLGL